jgi:hypothetical protein
VIRARGTSRHLKSIGGAPLDLPMAIGQQLGPRR